VKPLRIHPAAWREINLAHVWYENESPQSADRFFEELFPAIDRIPSWPNLPPLYMHGTRRIILSRFPFSIIYRELPVKIEVIAVAHAKRQSGYWKSRI